MMSGCLVRRIHVLIIFSSIYSAIVICACHCPFQIVAAQVLDTRDHKRSVSIIISVIIVSHNPQVFDNALMAADILDAPRTMIPRLNTILDRCLD
jgi:hypothetical protein